MMRSLLAKNIALNLSKSQKSNSQCSFDGEECVPSIYYGVTCVNLNNERGYYFPTPVTVTDSSGKETSDVYMIVGGCYKFSQPIESYQTLEVSVDIDEDGMKSKADYYVVTKQEAELNLILEGELSESSMSIETNGFYVYNPNKFSASAEFDNQILYQTPNPEDKILSKESPEVSDVIYSHYHLEGPESATSMSDSLTITISGNDPGDYPQKIWKVQPGLFTKDTPDDELPGGGLSGGAIAGIVIACIVVVGVAAFCIVWFVVLKKPCPCGGKSDKSADVEA